MRNEFEVGDTVYLKSGGPMWVIESISEASTPKGATTAKLVMFSFEIGGIYDVKVDTRCIASEKPSETSR